MGTITSLLAFILILGGIVFIHELGHFIAAKLAGVFVEEFALGMGPKIYSFKKGETLYRINLLPIGGYVKMLGEEETSSDPRSFGMQPIGQRAIIVSAGVIMNVFLAGVIYFIFLAINSFTLILPLFADYDFMFADVEPVIAVNYVAPDSPAEEAGLEVGDIINTVDGHKISSSEYFRDYVLEHGGEEVILVVGDAYGEGVTELVVTPRENPAEDEGAVGIILLEAVRISYTGVHKVFSGFEHSVNMIGYTVVLFKDLIVSAIETGDIRYVSDNVSGPVGVYVATDMVLQSAGIIGLLDMAGLMSSSLAFMNILPFPALDGGHLFLLILEKFRGKKLNPKIESWLTAGGFFLLMGFMLVISAKDIVQYGMLDKLMFWK